MKVLLLTVLLLFPLPSFALTILTFGDSLTSGYGLEEGEGFVPQLQQALKREKIDARLINGSVAGDTSANGLARLDWSMAEKPDIVLLELGANDALRGLDPRGTKQNLEKIIQAMQASGAKILLLGMKAPRNLGAAYVQEFDSLYSDLAQKYGLLLYPFFLEGIAANSALNQADGLHPSKEGVAKIIESLLPYLKMIIG